MRDTDLFVVNRNQKTYKEQKQNLLTNVEDTDLMLVNRDRRTYTVTGAEFKALADGEVIAAPTISTDSSFAPATLTATAAVVEGAIKDNTYNNWYKDGVAIPGTAEQLVYTATSSGTYKYEEKWDALSGNSTYTSAEIFINISVIAKPTVISPPDGAGVGGAVTYNPKTSAISSISSQQAAGEITFPSTGIDYSNGIIQIRFLNGSFVALQQMPTGTRVLQSSDGINWTLKKTFNEPTWGDYYSCISFGNGIYLIGGSNAPASGNQNLGGIKYSSDLVNWSSNVLPQTGGNRTIYDICSNGNQFVAVGTNGQIWQGNGYGMSAASAFTSSTLLTCVYSGSRFVIGNGSAQIWHSTSASGPYTQVNTPSAGQFAATDGNGKIMMMLQGGRSAMISDDHGLTWDVIPPSATDSDFPDLQYLGLAYGDGSFAAVGRSPQWNNGVKANTIFVVNASDRSQKRVFTSVANNWQAIAYGTVGSQGRWAIGYDSYQPTLKGQWAYNIYQWSGNLTTLNFGNDSIYKSTDNSETSLTISEVFRSGDSITQSNGGASGEVAQDATGSSITVVNTIGTWSAGQSVVSAREFTEYGPDPTNLEFVSSVPAASFGAINGWTNATWNVTDLSDSSVQTAVVPISVGSQQTLQAGGDISLNYGRTYEVNVKYEATDATEATSDNNRFQTRNAARAAAPTDYDVFYDTNNLTSIKDYEIIDRHGVDPTSNAAKELGYAELTEQCDDPVAGYEKQADGRYRPLCSFELEAANLTSQLNAIQAQIDSYNTP